jgi:hypothetical protein
LNTSLTGTIALRALIMSPLPASNICMMWGGLPARNAATAAARCSGYWPLNETATLYSLWVLLKSSPYFCSSSPPRLVRPIQNWISIGAPLGWAPAGESATAVAARPSAIALAIHVLRSVIVVLL